MSAPLPLGLRNPYHYDGDPNDMRFGPERDRVWREGAMAGARAVIAEMHRSPFISTAMPRDADILRSEILRLEHELKGET